jgi:hypothetical protein
MVHDALRAELHAGQRHGALLSKMDTTQHNRGWDLSIEKGIVSVELVNEAPKGSEVSQDRAKEKKRQEVKEGSLRVSNAGRFNGERSGPEQAEAEKKKPQEKKKEESRRAQSRQAHPSRQKTLRRWVASRFPRRAALPLDGHWRHIFFTYDGSGKASGVKIYVDGAPVATTVRWTRWQQTIRTSGSDATGLAISGRQSSARDALPGHPALWARTDAGRSESACPSRTTLRR